MGCSREDDSLHMDVIDLMTGVLVRMDEAEQVRKRSVYGRTCNFLPPDAVRALRRPALPIAIPFVTIQVDGQRMRLKWLQAPIEKFSLHFLPRSHCPTGYNHHRMIVAIL